ncbi:hypothetical protein B1B04_17035 [Lysinibacillus sp. KCTC 33748]|uniref:hypothetical protein n=1 Tax=Lysinibacillus sp. NPDC093692 TaxID=3390578 RepID=UPI0009A85B0F|nr:hypothetical protein B1B04_17035 [Lysinibacillus sp. KCTC 33748]
MQRQDRKELSVGLGGIRFNDCVAFVTILHASLLFGKGLRTANFSKDNQLEIIYVENGSKQKITANYYIEKDSVLYISNT